MKLEAQEYGFFMEAKNDDLVLSRTGRGTSPAGQTRYKFDIYAMQIFNHLAKQNPNMSQDKMAEHAKVGICEIFIKDGTLFEFDTLVNLEITKKRKGFGSLVVQALRDTIDGDLHINDIQAGVAAKFWESQGVQFDRNINDFTKPGTKVQCVVNGIIPKDFAHEKKVVKETSLSL